MRDACTHNEHVSHVHGGEEAVVKEGCEQPSMLPGDCATPQYQLQMAMKHLLVRFHTTTHAQQFFPDSPPGSTRSS